MEPIVVGIDVSKARLDVHISGLNEAFAVSRDTARLTTLIEKIIPLEPTLVGMEATGGLETFAIVEALLHDSLIGRVNCFDRLFVT